MSYRTYPRIHTSTRDVAQPEPNDGGRAQRQYSWVQTPVEMEGRRNLPQEDIPPLPIIPDSLRQAPEPVALQVPADAQHPYDQKPDPSIVGTHPSAYASYDHNGSPITDPREQYHGSTVPPSPGPLPTKTDLTPSYQQPGTMIVPDENPLTPTTPSLPQANPRPMIYQPQTPSTPVGFETHFPGQSYHPNQQIRGGTWKHGLCDCGDVGTCCTGVFCPCILYGKTQYRLSQRSDRKDPTNMLGYETFNGSCAVYAVLCGCNWILAVIQHTRVRKAYEIPGSVGSDCVRGLCCSCCTLSQDEKEMKFREGHARRNAGPASGVQYQALGGMSYPAPPK